MIKDLTKSLHCIFDLLVQCSRSVKQILQFSDYSSEFQRVVDLVCINYVPVVNFMSVCCMKPIFCAAEDNGFLLLFVVQLLPEDRRNCDPCKRTLLCHRCCSKCPCCQNWWIVFDVDVLQFITVRQIAYFGNSDSDLGNPDSDAS